MEGNNGINHVITTPAAHEWFLLQLSPLMKFCITLLILVVGYASSKQSKRSKGNHTKVSDPQSLVVQKQESNYN